MKRSWDNPEMTVLVKRKPDEVILAFCKTSGGGAQATVNGCLVGSGKKPCHI